MRPERLVGWSGIRIQREAETSDASKEAEDLAYAAWRWLGERSPWASYLVASPNFQFVRVGEELRIHWDNRGRVVDGRPVWSAQVGVHVMSVDAFVDESRDFSHRLLVEMDGRIGAIEAGAVRAQTVLNPGALREQHETWRAEFESYFREYTPDIAWREAESALQVIAHRKGLPF
jgi:hypothetical protein